MATHPQPVQSSNPAKPAPTVVFNRPTELLAVTDGCHRVKPRSTRRVAAAQLGTATRWRTPGRGGGELGPTRRCASRRKTGPVRPNAPPSSRTASPSARPSPQHRNPARSQHGDHNSKSTSNLPLPVTCTKCPARIPQSYSASPRDVSARFDAPSAPQPPVSSEARPSMRRSRPGSRPSGRRVRDEGEQAAATRTRAIEGPRTPSAAGAGKPTQSRPTKTDPPPPAAELRGPMDRAGRRSVCRGGSRLR